MDATLAAGQSYEVSEPDYQAMNLIGTESGPSVQALFSTLSGTIATLLPQFGQVFGQLVDGIAKSGLWLEKGMDNRMAAAEAVAKNYYNQNPRLLRYVLSTPPDRVTYAKLSLARGDFARAWRGSALRSSIVNETTGLRSTCRAVVASGLLQKNRAAPSLT